MNTGPVSSRNGPASTKAQTALIRRQPCDLRTCPFVSCLCLCDLSDLHVLQLPNFPIADGIDIIPYFTILYIYIYTVYMCDIMCVCVRVDVDVN